MVSSARQLEATSAAGGINDLHRLLLLAAKRRTPHKIDKFLLVIPASGECNSPSCFKGVQTTFIDGLNRAGVVCPPSLAGPPIYRCSLPFLWSVAVLRGPWLIHSAGPPSGPLALLFSPESSTLMHRFPPITGLYPPRSPDRKVLDHATTLPRLLARAAGS
jgi:hypothetical protein